MPKKAEGEKMIVELGVGILAIGALGYSIYGYRKRMKCARIRKEQVQKLKLLKKISKRGG